MKTPWMEMTVRDFQASLASSSPTPGGGTAAAISLGQAAALTIMVCDLTIGRDKWEEGWDAANSALSCAVRIMTRSGELAEEDSNAFDLVMSSYRLPKDSDEEIATRKESIQIATLGATKVPLETALLAKDLLTCLPDLARLGNANAVSDVGVAGLLASAACKGALFNVEINLNGLDSGHEYDEIYDTKTVILDESRILSKEIMDIVRSRI